MSEEIKLPILTRQLSITTLSGRTYDGSYSMRASDETSFVNFLLNKLYIKLGDDYIYVKNVEKIGVYDLNVEDSGYYESI